MIQAQTADSLIIEGKIPGLPAGLQVTLLSQEFHHRSEIAKTVSTDGAFRLTGKVASPTLCLLDIENENDPKSIGKEIELMVENGAIAISAAHADSLPPSFTFTTEKLLNACHVNIAGGRVQEEYAEYQRFMLPYLLAAKQAHYNLYIAPEADKRNETDSKPFEKKYKAAEYSADSAQMAFVRLNPDYAISSSPQFRLIFKQLRKMYTKRYTKRPRKSHFRGLFLRVSKPSHIKMKIARQVAGRLLIVPLSGLSQQ